MAGIRQCVLGELCVCGGWGVSSHKHSLFNAGLESLFVGVIADSIYSRSIYVKAGGSELGPL